MSGQIAKVAVENAAYSFDDAFDYAIPQNLQQSVVPAFVCLFRSETATKSAKGLFLRFVRLKMAKN